MLVKDFMIKDVYVMNETESLKSLLELFVEKKIGGVPVVDENNRLKGIISDGDVLRTLKPKTYTSYYAFYIEELDETIVANANKPLKKYIHMNLILP